MPCLPVEAANDMPTFNQEWGRGKVISRTGRFSFTRPTASDMTPLRTDHFELLDPYLQIFLRQTNEVKINA